MQNARNRQKLGEGGVLI